MRVWYRMHACGIACMRVYVHMSMGSSATPVSNLMCGGDVGVSRSAQLGQVFGLVVVERVRVQVVNTALDLSADEEAFVLPNSPSGPLVALAFKLEEGKYGQLTYVRVYSGTLVKGSVIVNQSTGKKHKVPRLVRTHSDELEDAESIQVCPGRGSFAVFVCAR